MKFEFLKKNSENLVILNKELLKTLEPQEDVLDFNVKYWLKTGKIISLKKGMYVLADAVQKIKSADKYLEYISGQLVQPAYLSAEYVLAKYQILSEPVQAITSVTTKKTQKFSNELGVFRYYSITEDLFTGYKIKQEGELVFAEADKSKALFDFLYFRFLKETDVDLVTIDNLRINWENITKSEFKKAETYLKLTNSRRLKKVFELIGKNWFQF